MRKIKIYSVVSIDGFACGENGEIDWLEEAPIPRGIERGMNEYYAGVDTVVMTRAFWSEMYACEYCYEFLSRHCVIIRTADEGAVSGHGNAEYLPADEGFFGAVQRVRELRAADGGDIWIAGGMDLVTAFFDAGLIDEIHVTMIPVALGRGIKLFPPSFRPDDWTIAEGYDYGSGVKQLIYRTARHRADNSIC